MGKCYNFTGHTQYGFSRKLMINNTRRMVTYTMYYAGTKEWDALNKEFGEEDVKIMAETINAVRENLADSGPITLEESTTELNKYEASYLCVVRDGDNSVFVAATVEDSFYMLLTCWAAGGKEAVRILGGKEKFVEKVEEFRNSL